MQRIMIRNALMLCLLLEWGAFAFVIQSKEIGVGQETSKNTIVNVRPRRRRNTEDSF